MNPSVNQPATPTPSPWVPRPTATTALTYHGTPTRVPGVRRVNR